MTSCILQLNAVTQARLADFCGLTKFTYGKLIWIQALIKCCR